jgi:hypothetical protein
MKATVRSPRRMWIANVELAVKVNYGWRTRSTRRQTFKKVIQHCEVAINISIPIKGGMLGCRQPGIGSRRSLGAGTQAASE